MFKKRRLSSKAVAVLSRHGGTRRCADERRNRFSTEAAASQSEPEPPKTIVSEVVAEQLKKVTRMHNGYHLTDEQDRAVDLAETGDDLKIEAYAGAGKTSTLSAVSKAKSNSCQQQPNTDPPQQSKSEPLTLGSIH